MILDQPRGEDEVDRQIISMSYDAVVVGTISSGNYRRIFFGDNKVGPIGSAKTKNKNAFSFSLFLLSPTNWVRENKFKLLRCHVTVVF